MGEGAYFDHQFNTVDVCIVMPTAPLTRMYRRHHERGMQRPLPGQRSDNPAGEVAAADLVDACLANARQVATR